CEKASAEASAQHGLTCSLLCLALPDSALDRHGVIAFSLSVNNLGVFEIRLGNQRFTVKPSEPKAINLWLDGHRQTPRIKRKVRRNLKQLAKHAKGW
ncbi:MAG TPA: hypothetical protein VE131_05690, partial [Terriglobales bacterium]|nr:hypothetical protein [Terriglobales bacterium]